MDVTVIIGTYGESSWADLARSRAIPSAEALDVPVIHVHADTLADARNQGIAQATTEWVCVLDADDQLEPGYFDAMAAGTADLRAPSVRYVRPPYVPEPYVPTVAGHRHACTADCLTEGNWLVVGSLVRRSMLLDIGGFRDFPIYEDYDLWARCWIAGATIEAIPAAVYRAYVRANSRNRGPSRDLKHATHQAIARANGLLVPA